jgi:regulator of replication initiation timing
MNDPINPLSAAFDAATSSPESAAPESSDFLASTLALLDGPAEAEPPEPAAPAEAKLPEPGVKDPLASIDDDFPELDDKATPQAKAKWGELKSELKQERAAIRAMRDELEGLKQKSLYDPKEVETLKQQVEEYNKELAVHRIEATKEYREAITEPLKAIGSAAESLARRYELDQEAFYDALATTDEARQQKLLSDVVDGMSDRDRLKVYQMADDTLLLLRKRDDMKARSHEAMQELEIRQQESAERDSAERRRVFTSQVDRVFEAFADKVPFHPLAPTESKSAVLEQLRQDALAADVSGAGADVQAYSAAAGVVLPRLIKQFRALAAENQSLKNRIGNTAAASPTKARPVSPGAASQTATTDFLEAVMSQLPS